jgi:hypothetical protein
LSLRASAAAAAVLVLLALLAAPVVGAAAEAASPQPSSQHPRAAIVFVPGPPPKVKPAMIDRLAQQPGLALGFMSAIMGSYSPEQVLLDVSAGSRTWTSLYSGDLETPMTLLPRGSGGEISGWQRAAERADTPPADVEPGSLAQSLGRAGLPVAFAGKRGSSNREAIVAADRSGRVQRVTLAGDASIAGEAVRAWARSRLLVARLPSGAAGREALEALLAARRPADLVLAVQQPTAVRRRLLAIGAAGLEGSGSNVRSGSTRTDGLVVSTDLAPTVLERLGLDVPDQMSGEPMRAAGSRSPEQLSELRNRLSDVGPRRWTVVLLGLLGGALVAGALGSVAPGRARRTARCAFLAALWLPPVLLATGAIAPTGVGEMLLIAAFTGLLALATDVLLPWPSALAAVAAVAIGTEIVDLALGSTLTARSLLGPNPILGARFYGVGNELEVTLAVIALFGIGALLATAPPRTLVWGFVIGGGLLAFALSWGRLGADVGASVMLAAGSAAAAVAALGERPGRRRIAIVLVAPVAALGALAVLDLATGGDAHFTRSVLRAGGLGELAEVAQRRVELSYNSLGRGIIWLLVAIAVGALVWGVRSRERLLSRLGPQPGLRAALWGALVAVVIGALTNDSGPLILLIGTSYLALAAGYLHEAPNPGSRARERRW